MASTVLQQTDMATAMETVTESHYENGETAIMATAMMETAIMVATATTMMKHEAATAQLLLSCCCCQQYHEPKP